MEITMDQARADVHRLSEALDKQANLAKLLDDYYEGHHPIPEAVKSTKAVRAYKLLMSMARTDWPKLIVDSVEERLEVQAIKFTDKVATDEVWKAWQANGLDADSSISHQATLTNGRSYVLVWADAAGEPLITPEHASTMIVEYAVPSRRLRAAALRRWTDGSRWYATLYRPEGLYKFQSSNDPAVMAGGAPASIPTGVSGWEARETSGETWPLENPLGVVPVVEISVNRMLKPCRYGTGHGEYESAIQHIDRINYTVFSALAAMTWSGFPLRAQIGDPILYDDDGNALAPFDVSADRLVQIENPDGKLMQLPEATLSNYTTVLETHIRHLAATTKTPAHYLLGEMVNLSADAIRAAEAGLVSKTRRHQRLIGEAWEDVARLALAVKNNRSATDESAELVWKDPESRSMAERADAALKLKDILPWQALASKVLGASPQEIAQWSTDRASDGFAAMLAAGAGAPPPPAGG